MKPEYYITILHENLKVRAIDLNLGQWFCFHRDNNPIQKSKSVTEWLKKLKINFLRWPSRNGEEPRSKSNQKVL